jgi:hypothetical protein
MAVKHEDSESIDFDMPLDDIRHLPDSRQIDIVGSGKKEKKNGI